MDDLETRAARLAAILAGLGSVAVAYSGGTDSAFLLAASLEALGAGAVLAVTADSPLMPRAELAEARALAARLGARHVVLPHDELAREAIVANPPDRCYHCKFDRFDLLWRVARAEGLALADEDGELTDVAMPAEGTEAHVTLLVAEFLNTRAGAVIDRSALAAFIAVMASAVLRSRPVRPKFPAKS